MRGMMRFLSSRIVRVPTCRLYVHLHLSLFSVRMHLASSSLSSSPHAMHSFTTRRMEEETADDNILPQEWYMHLICPLVFGLFLSFISFVIGYFSYLEAGLLTRYKDEGNIVRAEVVSRMLLRGKDREGGNAHAAVCADMDAATYAIYVHYYYEITSDYTVKIRKRLTKIRKDDMAIDWQQSAGEEPKGNVNNIESAYAPPSVDTVITKSSSDAVERQAANHIDLYVLTGHPRSGCAKMHVDRASGLSHRLQTLFLPGVFLCIGGLCFWYSVHVLLWKESPAVKEEKLEWTMLIAAGALLVLQIWLIPQFLHKSLQCVLNEEYIENGDFLSVPRDDSTISFSSLWSTGTPTSELPLTNTLSSKVSKVASSHSFQFLS